MLIEALTGLAPEWVSCTCTFVPCDGYRWAFLDYLARLLYPLSLGLAENQSRCLSRRWHNSLASQCHRSAGYVELPGPVVQDLARHLEVEIRFRYNDNGGMYIGESAMRCTECFPSTLWPVDYADTVTSRIPAVSKPALIIGLISTGHDLMEA
jgi:hypothetical protein